MSAQAAKKPAVAPGPIVLRPCPKCGYDLTGVPARTSASLKRFVKCPECGKASAVHVTVTRAPTPPGRLLLQMSLPGLGVAGISAAMILVGGVLGWHGPNVLGVMLAPTLGGAMTVFGPIAIAANERRESVESAKRTGRMGLLMVCSMVCNATVLATVMLLGVVFGGVAD